VKLRPGKVFLKLAKPWWQVSGGAEPKKLVADVAGAFHHAISLVASSLGAPTSRNPIRRYRQFSLRISPYIYGRSQLSNDLKNV
jgi:hypothetical protein